VLVRDPLYFQNRGHRKAGGKMIQKKQGSRLKVVVIVHAMLWSWNINCGQWPSGLSAHQNH
jgi:hypothetical protein